MNQTEQVRQALQRAFNLGQRYWQQADSEYESEHKKADATYAIYRQLVEETAQALAADHIPDATKMVEPAKLVRLTEVELLKAFTTAEKRRLVWQVEREKYLRHAKIVMDAMIAKNGGKI